VNLRVEIALTSSSGRVTTWMVVWSILKHSASSIASAVGVERVVRTRNDSRVEASGGEVVLLLVNDLLLEHIAGLLSNPLSNELVVNRNIGHIALVAWDHSSLFPHRAFAGHVVIGGPIEIVVGPAEELVLVERVAALVVAETELGAAL